MATEFKKIQYLLQPSKKNIPLSDDSIYWKNLEFPVTVKHPGAVTHIEFSPIQPFNYLVTASTRVQVCSSRSNLPLKTYHQFAESARSASYRLDGQLIVAGSDDKKIRILHEKYFEQILTGHEGPVHATKFLDNFKIVSASDDKSTKVWDIGTKSQISSFHENQDYCRCVSSAEYSDIFLSGSYDHTVRLYDQRCQKSINCFKHGSPVESVLLYPGGRLFASSGGTEVKIWDIVKGGLLAMCSNHHKTITNIIFCSRNQRLVSASLDRHLKFYNLIDYKIVHTLDYSSALLSAAISTDDGYVAVGSVDGLISVQRKTPFTELQEKDKPKKRIRKKHSPKFDCPLGKPLVRNEKDVGEFTVETGKRHRVTKYDKYLRKFKYSRALDEVMELTFRSKNADVTLAVLHDLNRRNGLASAVAGRTDKSLSSILTFILKNFVPPHLQILIDLLFLIIEIYGDEFDSLSESTAVLRRLVAATNDRVSFQMDTIEVSGCLKMLFANTPASDCASRLNAATVE